MFCFCCVMLCFFWQYFMLCYVMLCYCIVLCRVVLLHCSVCMSVYLVPCRLSLLGCGYVWNQTEVKTIFKTEDIGMKWFITWVGLLGHAIDGEFGSVAQGRGVEGDPGSGRRQNSVRGPGGPGRGYWHGGRDWIFQKNA